MSARGPPASEEKRAVRFRAGGMTTLFKAKSILKSHASQFLLFFFGGVELTPETTPASHVAGRVVGQDVSRGGKTGSLDGIREGDGVRQLDQGNVVTRA